tara:strand:+ start:1123 stop:1596 length:474 start_codon:yes stop_codon:yes gene_type:complete
MKKLTLDDKGVIKLLSDLTEHAGKRGIMFQMLLHMLSDDQINMLFNYLHKEYNINKRFKLFEINDRVVFKPGKYDFNDLNIDVMQDKRLMLNGYMTGKITGSPNYGNNFNPTYYRMTLDVPILDDDNNIVMKVHDVNTLDLKFMDGYQHDYFNHVWG